MSPAQLTPLCFKIQESEDFVKALLANAPMQGLGSKELEIYDLCGADGKY
jgi:hypothetical protein